MDRLRRAVDEHGMLGTARLAVERLRMDEEHIWYQLDLPSPTGAPFENGDALRLVEVERDGDLAAFERLDSVRAEVAAERRAGGAQAWLVLDGEQVLFGCWIFPERTPMIAAPGGWLELPPEVVCLEDSIAAPEARGRRIAPRTWNALAHRWAEAGATAMVTKVEASNEASRRAVLRAGFREIAVMRFRRRGPFRSVTLEELAPGLSDALRERLAA